MELLVQLRLLGPVELELRGRIEELGPPQRRTVVAALAVDAGRPVPVDVLTERIWGAGPPPGARRALYAHIARIRRVCERTGDAGEEPLRLLRRSGGYQLEAGPDQVDLHRFRRLDKLARRPGQPVGAQVSLLREALALWRGEPLTGMDGPWAERVRQAWHRRRVDAAVLLAEAELRAGEPAAVVQPLTELLGEYPLAEPLAEVLMRALHAVGDNAGALRCFAEIRERLVEELGADPGERLGGTHTAILRGRRFGGGGRTTAPGDPVGTGRPVEEGRRFGGGVGLSGTYVPGGAGSLVGAPRTTEPALSPSAASVRRAHLAPSTPSAAATAAGPSPEVSAAPPVPPVPAAVVPPAEAAAVRLPAPAAPAASGERRSGTGAPPWPSHDIPAQLPMSVGDFTGRVEELARLHDLLAEVERQPTAVVISALSGTAGVGKTALAVHWARQVRAEFPDGQVYVNLRGFDPGRAAMGAGEAIRGFLDAFGVPADRVPRGLDAQAALYRSLLAGRRVLIVLDNARDADHVRPLLPGAPGCLALVTSRNRLTGLAATEGAHLLPVDLLTPAEARALLAGRLGVVRMAAEPAAVDEIVVQCAGLPLALAVVAARAAGRPGLPLAGLAEELRTADRRLDPLDGGDSLTGVRSVFQWSYRMLSPAAARLFRLLGLHPGPDTALPAAAALAGVTAPEARTLLAELTEAQLVTEHRPGRYTFHDLLRAYAAELTAVHDSEETRHTAVHRLLDHYLHTAYAADALLTRRRDPMTLAPALPGALPGRPTGPDEALAWFAAEYSVLLSVVQHGQPGFETHTWQLATTLGTFLERQGHWQALADAHTTALDSARRSHDKAGQANAHRGLGLARHRLGSPDRSREHYLLGLGLFQELGNHAGQARIRQNLAIAASARGDHPEALEHARLSLDHFRAAHDRGGQAIALNEIGWYLAKLGDHREALASCRQALAAVQEIGDLNGEAHTWDSLGYVHRLLGRFTEAVDCYEQALRLFRKTGDLRSEAIGLAYLGDTLEAAGEPEAARGAWTRALAVFDELGLPEADPLRDRLRRPPPQ
ncbi:AfsR/SARP family transcriptional regulator [Streptomyces sp. CA-249302]|uniref:AfsR/SARP family transcriptional regulator n=1 Tax=Streptomyces sp. CA-249302 TaxID=3240058 RepID=UPI003D8D1B2B